MTDEQILRFVIGYHRIGLYLLPVVLICFLIYGAVELIRRRS